MIAVGRRNENRSHTDEILLPWGISLLRSGYRPHSGRNDSIKQSDTIKVLSLRGAQRATWQSRGREDLLADTNFIPLPRGISPLRSGYRPHSGRNDSIKQSDTIKVLSLRGAQRATWQSRGREDLLADTNEILLPWGISPLRSDYRPHSGRNDIINKTDCEKRFCHI